MACTQILVHRWSQPRTRILALFQSQTKQEFRFICGTGFVYSNAFFKTSVFMVVDGVCAVAVFELFCVFNFFV